MTPLVLHTVFRYLPLTETWIYGQIQALSGFRQAVACVGKEGPERFPFEPIASLGDHGAARALAGMLGAIARMRGQSDARFDRLLAPWYRHAWPMLERRQLRAWAPDVVHAHFGDHATRSLGLAAAARAPLVTTFYGYDLALARDPFWRKAYQRLFQDGERFLVEGSAMARKLSDLGCPDAKIHVQHLGVDLAGIPYRPRVLGSPSGGPPLGGSPVGGPSDDTCRVLISASFREKKGIPHALSAYARVLARHPGRLSLTVIGDGPLREQIHAHARSLGLHGHVRWLGYQAHAVFLEEALSAHVFLHPSLTAKDGDTEGGAPVSILEAQATGLPVLSTRHADIPEATTPDSAVLVPEGDVDALALALEALALHPERWSAMSEAGRRHVAREYDATQQGRRLAAQYHAAIEAHARRRHGFTGARKRPARS